MAVTKNSEHDYLATPPAMKQQQSNFRNSALTTTKGDAGQISSPWGYERLSRIENNNKGANTKTEYGINSKKHLPEPHLNFEINGLTYR